MTTHDDTRCGRKRTKPNKFGEEIVHYTKPCNCGGPNCAPIQRVTAPVFRVVPDDGKKGACA